MSFLKALIIAILVTVLITYFLGASILDFIGYHAVDHKSWLESIKTINLSALATLAIIVLVSFVLLTVFGTVVLFVALCFGAILLIVLGAFWPFILIACVLYFLCRDKKGDDYYCG